MSIKAPTYTQTPNEIFTLLPVMKDTELRVTLIIIRDTFGWQQGGSAVALSLTDLMERTGLSKQGVFNGLKAGRERGTIYQVKAAGTGKAAYGLVVNDVDRSTELTGQVNRPAAVNSVDRSGQHSRPVVVNSVDRQTPAQPAPSAEKTDVERNRNKNEIKEKEKRECERPDLEAESSPPLVVNGRPNGRHSFALPSLAQKIGTAEQRPPAHSSTGVSQVQANAQHDTNQEPRNVPGAAARPVEKPVDNFRSTGELLNRVFGTRVIADMIGNPASLADRKRWYSVPLERALELLGQAKTEARRSGYTPQTVLKKLLDDEVLRDGLPPVSTPISESAPAVGKHARFEEGQRVVFRGLPYSVLTVGERKLTLRTDDEDADELDVLFSSNDFAAVRVVGG